MLDKEVRERFKEFQKRTGKYEDLEIDEVRFGESYPFNDDENIKLIGSKNIANHTELNNINDVNGLPVYDASVNINTLVDEKNFLSAIFEVEDDKNPDISFASEGNSSAGTNFIIHKCKYFINNHRTVMKFTKKYYSKYIYYNIFDMKKKYAFKRGYTPSKKELKRLRIKIPIPKDLNKTYTSFKVQEAIVAFLEDGFNKIKTIKTFLDKRYALIEKLKLSLIPSTFIQEYVKISFARYAKENDIGFKITDVEFEKIPLSNIANFPAMTRVTGGIDISIDEYSSLSVEKKKNFFALVSGTVENNQISGYIDKDRLSKNSLSNANIISWTRINGEHFFIQKKPVCTNDDSFIMDVRKDSFSIKYIQYATMRMMKSQLFHWGNKAGKNKVKIVQVPIPKLLNNYTSLEIQKIIANFIEEKQNKIQNEFDKMNVGYSNLERLHKAYLARTFTMIDWSVK